MWYYKSNAAALFAWVPVRLVLETSRRATRRPRPTQRFVRVMAAVRLNCRSARRRWRDAAVLIARTGEYELTTDQTAATEAERVRTQGGYISYPEEGEGGIPRVWLDAEMVAPGLSVSRSIGDFIAEPIGVTADAEMRRDALRDDHRVLILGSDGVWDFVSGEEAVNIARQHSDDATQAAKVLINTAMERWYRADEPHRDDITAIVVSLPLVCTAKEATVTVLAESRV